MEQSKNKRARRTRAELEADVFDAIRQLAMKKVWRKLPLRILCKEPTSNVRPTQ